ncbi:MAG: hypothetical protein Q8K79_10060 [Solirubrobacteraceae bacterium]|nr:hypothetical protein [Solirubrobacteraceae bacterium]
MGIEPIGLLKSSGPNTRNASPKTGGAAQSSGRDLSAIGRRAQGLDREIRAGTNTRDLAAVTDADDPADTASDAQADRSRHGDCDGLELPLRSAVATLMAGGAGMLSCVPGWLALYVGEDGSTVLLLTHHAQADRA